ncbi:MAG: hypothetical protein Q9187_002739 [Circinaria calcarea]
MSSQVTTSSANTSQAPRSKRKLRESCNGCNQAKVKCDKSQPWCARCTSRGIVCVYSLSLRSGKRRADQTDLKVAEAVEEVCPDQTQLPYKSAAPSSTPLQDNPIPVEGDVFQELLNYFNAESLRGKLNFLAKLDPQWVLENRQGQMYEGPEPPPADDGKYHQAQSWHQASSRSSLSTLPSTMSPFSPFPSPQVSPEGFSASLQSSATDESFTSESSRHLNSIACSLHTELPLPSPITGCQCFQLALQKLSSVNLISMSQTATFDVALQQGKESIALLGSILRCSCRMLDHVLVIILASLISRTLSLYQSLCTVYLGHRSPPCAGHEETNNRNPSRRAPQARVTLGMYELDEDDQDRLKLNIVWLELQKVEDVILIFREQLCAANSVPWLSSSASSTFNGPFSVGGLEDEIRSPTHGGPGGSASTPIRHDTGGEDHSRLHCELAEILARDLKMAYEAVQGRMRRTNTDRRATWYSQEFPL